MNVILISGRIGKREWEFTPFGHEYQRKGYEGLPFSLMSYNVLAQELLHDNQYLYRNHSDQVLDWEYRKHKLLQEFEFHQPDVSCWPYVKIVLNQNVKIRYYQTDFP
jgi:mRNA deadenylase 3'-5' endonuclease subunit Ccr4